jgi:hypothetical protein
VLLRARADVTLFLRNLLFSTAEDLGEPSKESQEEMQERSQRVTAQILLSLSAIVCMFPTSTINADGNPQENMAHPPELTRLQSLRTVPLQQTSRRRQR